LIIRIEANTIATPLAHRTLLVVACGTSQATANVYVHNLSVATYIKISIIANTVANILIAISSLASAQHLVIYTEVSGGVIAHRPQELVIAALGTIKTIRATTGERRSAGRANIIDLAIVATHIRVRVITDAIAYPLVAVLSLAPTEKLVVNTEMRDGVVTNWTQQLIIATEIALRASNGAALILAPYLFVRQLTPAAHIQIGIKTDTIACVYAAYAARYVV
jgi:hypothetical protein